MAFTTGPGDGEKILLGIDTVIAVQLSPAEASDLALAACRARAQETGARLAPRDAGLDTLPNSAPDRLTVGSSSRDPDHLQVIADFGLARVGLSLTADQVRGLRQALGQGLRRMRSGRP